MREESPMTVEFSRSDFLRTGVIFFIFSLTIFVSLNIPASLSLFPFIEWHLSSPVAHGLFITQIVVIAMAAAVWFSCIVGIFKPEKINNFLSTRVMTSLRSVFRPLFYLAFLSNFLIASIHILASAAPRYTDGVFVAIYAFVIFWAIVIPVYFNYSDKRQNSETSIEVKFYCKKCGQEVSDIDTTCRNCQSQLSEVGKQKHISIVLGARMGISASTYALLTKPEQKILNKTKGWIFKQLKKFELSEIEIGFPSGLKIKFTKTKDK